MYFLTQTVIMLLIQSHMQGPISLLTVVNLKGLRIAKNENLYFLAPAQT